MAKNIKIPDCGKWFLRVFTDAGGIPGITPTGIFYQRNLPQAGTAGIYRLRRPAFLTFVEIPGLRIVKVIPRNQSYL
jgi:hypothetical protein